MQTSVNSNSMGGFCDKVGISVLLLCLFLLFKLCWINSCAFKLSGALLCITWRAAIGKYLNAPVSNIRAGQLNWILKWCGYIWLWLSSGLFVSFTTCIFVLYIRSNWDPNPSTVFLCKTDYLWLYRFIQGFQTLHILSNLIDKYYSDILNSWHPEVVTKQCFDCKQQSELIMCFAWLSCRFFIVSTITIPYQ